MGKLTKKKIEALTRLGLHGDGETLFINVALGGTKSWVQRITIQGRRRHLGLGGWPVVSIEKARRKAFENRVAVSDGRDPYTERQEQKSLSTIPTFREAAVRYFEENRPRWKAGRHTDQWMLVIEKYAVPAFGKRRVDHLTQQDVLRLLAPIWTDIPQQARRLRARVRAVLQWCVAHGFVRSNVAGEVIDGALPAMPLVKHHHKSLPYEDVHDALKEIDQVEGVPNSARWCLQFVILTAARSSEGIHAMWTEIDWQDRTWTVPAHKIKMKKEHRVPLSRAALTLLERAQAVAGSSPFIFPSPQDPRRAMSDTALNKLLHRTRLGTRTVVHGFRTSFRVWGSEQTNADRAVLELCLAHKIGSATEQAYSRSDLLTKRRVLMERWGEYVTQPPSSKVVSLHS